MYIYWCIGKVKGRTLVRTAKTRRSVAVSWLTWLTDTCGHWHWPHVLVGCRAQLVFCYQVFVNRLKGAISIFVFRYLLYAMTFV